MSCASWPSANIAVSPGSCCVGRKDGLSTAGGTVEPSGPSGDLPRTLDQEVSGSDRNGEEREVQKHLIIVTDGEAEFGMAFAVGEIDHLRDSEARTPITEIIT
jgi:hypothetical protein